MSYKNMNFLKFLEENGISRRYARNAFAGFVIATIAPFIYHYDYFISPPPPPPPPPLSTSPSHEIESDEAIEDYFFNLPSEEYSKYLEFSTKVKKEYIAKKAEKFKSKLVSRPE